MDCSKKTDVGKSSQAQRSTTTHLDLIPALPNEITLIALMACMPWHMKPLLMTLNRAWACTLKNPLYATPHYKPRALKNSVIFYAYISTTNNDPSLSLHIYGDDIVRRLPLPPHIAGESYESTRFLVSDQCVYALSPAHRDKSMIIYSISKLDLGGGLINWQSLPPLPKIGNYVHILSRISEDGRSTVDYMWWMRDNGMREYNYVSTEERRAMAETNDWSALEMHTTQGGIIPAAAPPAPAPARPLQHLSNHLPKYLYIRNTDKWRWRHLYKLFTVYECSLQIRLQEYVSHSHNRIEEEEEGGATATATDCLLVFKDGHDNSVIREVHNVCNKINGDGSVDVYLFKRDIQNAERIEGDEFNEFYGFLRYLHPNGGLDPVEEISAVKFTADLSGWMNGWQQMFRLPARKAGDLVLNEGSTIKVAQQGILYAYLHCAAMEGKPETPTS